ncbi:DB module [Aphelenchoides besseyi]|nr:DB module [Aphelenchoides besseyi]
MILRFHSIWPLLITFSTAQWFQAPAFDCGRIPQRWCCSPRVRANCPDLCRLAPTSCGPKPPQPFNSLLPGGLGLPLSGLLGGLPQLPNLLPTQPSQAVWNVRPQPSQTIQPQGSIQPPPGIILPPETPLAVGPGIEFPELIKPPTRSTGEGPRAVDGLASSRSKTVESAVGAGGSFGPETNVAGISSNGLLPPIDPPPFTPFVTATPSTFPTLITMSPSVFPTFRCSTLGRNYAAKHRRFDNSAKSRGILPPPNRFAETGEEKLIELEEQDGHVTQVPTDSATAVITRGADGIDRASAGIAQTLILGTPGHEHNPSDLSSSLTQHPTAAPLPTSSEVGISPNSRTTLPDGAPWSFKIMPSLNTVINSLFTKKTIDTITNFTGKRPPKRGNRKNSSTTQVIASTVSSVLSTTSNLNVATNSTTNGKCGTSPDFRPCVPIQKANDQLLQCCRAKLMPEGCLSLCRYDTTQAEVKKAFDAGRCGILNVAPFLDCASQAQDNRQCCSHRQLAKKRCELLDRTLLKIHFSGPQCEIFCHPKDGLALSLTHLVCQNVISDLLQCHHAGLH